MNSRYSQQQQQQRNNNDMLVDEEASLDLSWVTRAGADSSSIHLGGEEEDDGATTSAAGSLVVVPRLSLAGVLAASTNTR